MGIREALNRNPTGSIVLVSLLVLASAAYTLYRLTRPTGPRPVSQGLAFYSSDDGKTWFADSITRPSPFDKDGKTAYRVYVWKGTDGKAFVSHLQRTSSAPPPKTGGATRGLPTGVSAADAKARPGGESGSGVEVKRPGTGENGWTRLNTSAGEAITVPTCPSGGESEPLEP